MYYLVEENILPIAALGRKVLEVAVLADAMLLAELLPELTAHCSTDRVSVSDAVVECRSVGRDVWYIAGKQWVEERTHRCCRIGRLGW